MSIGTVVINNLNLMQGALPAVERYLLFVGAGTQDVGKLLTLNTDTDLDSVLGDAADLRIQPPAPLSTTPRWNPGSSHGPTPLTWLWNSPALKASS